jgi:hypothetical protein
MLQQIQKEAEDRFDKEFDQLDEQLEEGYYPPVEKDIKTFLSSEIKMACEKILEAVLPEYVNDRYDFELGPGHNSCIKIIKENAKKLGL